MILGQSLAPPPFHYYRNPLPSPSEKKTNVPCEKQGQLEGGKLRRSSIFQCLVSSTRSAFGTGGSVGWPERRKRKAICQWLPLPSSPDRSSSAASQELAGRRQWMATSLCFSSHCCPVVAFQLQFRNLHWMCISQKLCNECCIVTNTQLYQTCGIFHLRRQAASVLDVSLKMWLNWKALDSNLLVRVGQWQCLSVLAVIHFNWLHHHHCCRCSLERPICSFLSPPTARHNVQMSLHGRRECLLWRIWPVFDQHRTPFLLWLSRWWWWWMLSKKLAFSAALSLSRKL